MKKKIWMKNIKMIIWYNTRIRWNVEILYNCERNIFVSNADTSKFTKAHWFRVFIPFICTEWKETLFNSILVEWKPGETIPTQRLWKSWLNCRKLKVLEIRGWKRIVRSRKEKGIRLNCWGNHNPLRVV